MARKEYDTFVQVLPEEGEMSLTIRELTPYDPRKKYCHRKVRAVISKSEMADGDILYLRSTGSGRVLPGDWYIKILK